MAQDGLGLRGSCGGREPFKGCPCLAALLCLLVAFVVEFLKAFGFSAGRCIRRAEAYKHHLNIYYIGILADPVNARKSWGCRLQSISELRTPLGRVSASHVRGTPTLEQGRKSTRVLHRRGLEPRQVEGGASTQTNGDYQGPLVI